MSVEVRTIPRTLPVLCLDSPVLMPVVHNTADVVGKIALLWTAVDNAPFRKVELVVAPGTADLRASPDCFRTALTGNRACICEGKPESATRTSHFPHRGCSVI